MTSHMFGYVRVALTSQLTVTTFVSNPVDISNSEVQTSNV